MTRSNHGHSPLPKGITLLEIVGLIRISNMTKVVTQKVEALNKRLNKCSHRLCLFRRDVYSYASQNGVQGNLFIAVGIHNAQLM